MRILYDSKNPKFKKPFGCTTPTDSVWICIHIPVHCMAHSVDICFSGEEELRVPLYKKSSENGYDLFSGEFLLKKCGLYFYKFHISSPTGSFDLYKEGFSDTNMCTGDMWQISCIPSDYHTPQSFWGKVMYQIFPDRFHKYGECDLSSKLSPYTVHASTEECPQYEKNNEGKILNNDFFGGNFKGIENKLDYICSLGAEVIYLNPIFKAFSNHRYDTCDYKKCDPMLGSEKDFADLCKIAHSKGIKIILDGVFSHTGSDSIYFDKENRFGTGVCSNPDSPYKSWYTKNPQGEYNTWWGIETLPNVNEMEESYLNYIIRDKDSVIRHWLSLGADGFRLDVADELPDEFIYLLRSEVKKINPEAIVIGEVWEDASNKIAYGIRRRYFCGNEVDSVMNYPFRESIICLCSGAIDSGVFCDSIMTICENYPTQAINCLMNSLSTHDTPRIMTVLSGARLNMTRHQNAGYVMSSAELQRANERIYLAIFLLFVLPGCPCIYYGDERGTFGFGDPFNRGYMDWDKCNVRIFEFYTGMAEIRKNHIALRQGETRVYTTSDDNICIQRTFDGEILTAHINLSHKDTQIPKCNVLTGKSLSLTANSIYIEPGGFVLWQNPIKNKEMLRK